MQALSGLTRPKFGNNELTEIFFYEEYFMSVSKKQLIKLLRKIVGNKIGIGYVLRHIRNNAPSRRPTGNYLAVHDTIASRKMGWTRDSESRSAELPFVLWCEFSSDVLFYWSQPEPIKVSYKNSGGRTVSYLITSDFLIVTRNEVYLVECKKKSWIDNAIVEHPNKYRKTDKGYEYIPALETAAAMGLGHRISTDQDFTPTFTRNCIFLLNFIDDLSIHDETESEKIAECIKHNGNRLKLNKLYEVFSQLSVLRGFFHKKLFLNFDKELLCNPETSWVYAEKNYLDALRITISQNNLLTATAIEQLINEKYIWWNDTEFEILLATLTPAVSMKIRSNNRIINLSASEIEDLIKLEEIYVITPDNTEKSSANILCSKKSYQIDEAILRHSIISGNKKNDAYSSRTVYRLKAKIKTASDPLVALLSKKELRGNRVSRLSEDVLNLMQKCYKNLLRPSPSSVYTEYGNFVDECKKMGLSECSYKSFNARFKKFDTYYITLKQKGFRAAYALGPQPRGIDLEWDLPYHGDFIFEIAHVDHTPIELTLVSKLNGEVLEGTLTLSIMYDGHSRIILAIYISFEKPSYRSTMMLLRECYRRFKRLPLFLAVDHGPDFESVYFDSTLADLGMNKRRRPKSASRHGSIIERVFGTTESELIHTLAGNKQLQKLGRGQSTTHKSEKFAVWTPDEFNTRLKDYAYLRYPTINRRGISETPQNRWDCSLKKFDEMPGTKVLSETSFFISTLPDADGDGYRVIKKNQISFRHTAYLLSKKVPGYSGAKSSVRVKYNPYDYCHIWALIEGHWVKMTTNDVLVRECHDKGIQLPHMEIFSRHLRNGRRYRKGPKQSAAIHFNHPQLEQHSFNTKNSNIGLPDTTENEALSTNFSIDIQSIEILPFNDSQENKDEQ
jgi:putative transposase